MNWKTDLKLSDLVAAAPVEIACRVRGQTRTETAAALMRRPELAVRRRARKSVGADVAAAAAVVLDHHRLRPFLGKLIGNDPRQRIKRGAWRERHDDLHQMGWKCVLRSSLRAMNQTSVG